ncbi:hypothetical protein Tco_1489915 [Tanacetum coccineum]
MELAPHVGIIEEEKKTFWDSLDETVREFPTDQQLIIGGDLNGHIGAAVEGYPCIHGVSTTQEGRECLTENLVEEPEWGRSEGIQNESGGGATIQKEVISASDTDCMWNTLALIIQKHRRNLGGILLGHRRLIRPIGNLDGSVKRDHEGRDEVVNHGLLPQLDGYYSRIIQAEVRVALQKIGKSKAVGLDQILIEAWKGLEDKGLIWLTSLFNKIFISAKMPG